MTEPLVPTPPLVKPPRMGGFLPGLVAPEWQWAWKGLVLAVPLWEGGGAPKDFSPRQQVIETPDSTFTWVGGEYGLALSQSGSDSNGLQITGAAQSLIDLPTTYNFTVEIWAKRDSALASKCAFGWTGTDDLMIYPNDATVGSGGVRVFWRDVGGNLINESGPDLSGQWHQTVFLSRASNNHQAYRDGVSVGTSASTGTAGPFTGITIGAFGDVTTQPLTGDLLLVRVWDRVLSVTEIAALARDPFGPFRAVDPWGYDWSSADLAAAAGIGRQMQQHGLYAGRG